MTYKEASKSCRICKVSKPLLAFYISPKYKRMENQCWDCRKLLHKEWRLKHAKRELLKAKDKINKRRAWLRQLKERTPCKDCGRLFPWWITDFDHVRGLKYKPIANLVSTTFSIKKIQEEIDKCELVCANCHRERTYHRSWKNWVWNPAWHDKIRAQRNKEIKK